MRMEKERAANEAQRNASTAKVRNLSCKRVPRDSFLTATRNGCNQAQTDPPTRSPNKMLHRKTPLQECSSFTPNTLQQISSPSTIQLNIPLQKGLNKQRVESLGQWDLNTHVGGLFRQGKCPYQKDLYPYLSSRSLSNLLLSIEWTMYHSQHGGMASQWTPSTPSWLATSSPTFPYCLC